MLRRMRSLLVRRLVIAACLASGCTVDVGEASSSTDGGAQGGSPGLNGDADGAPSVDGSTSPAMDGSNAAVDGAVLDSRATAPEASSADAGITSPGDGQALMAHGDAHVPGVSLSACAATKPNGAVLLDVGHANYRPSPSADEVQIIYSGKRALSSHGGRWVLWDVASRALIASGPVVCGASECPARPLLKGSLLVLFNMDGTEVRDSGDGHLVASLPTLRHVGWEQEPPRAGAALDGSYFWVQSRERLDMFSAAGTLLASRSGDYRHASAFGTPATLRVAGGPAGPSIIESVALPSGSVTTSSMFVGKFLKWSDDGARFITEAASAIRVYDADLSLRKLLAVPSTSGVGTYGEYLWVLSGGSTVQVVSLAGGDMPVLSTSGSRLVSSSGGYLAMESTRSDRHYRSFKTVDLTTTPPTVREYDLEVGTYAGNESGAWVVANSGLALQHVEAGSLNHRELSCGSVRDLAVSPNGTWAIALAARQILVGSISSRLISDVLALDADKVDLSEDGRFLVARTFDPQNSTGRSIIVHDLQMRNEVRRVAATSYADFALARQAERLVEVACLSGGCEYRVVDLSGATTYQGPRPIQPLTRVVISPDGGRVAISTAGYDPVSETGLGALIHEGSSLTGAAEGFPIGWIDRDRLAVRVRATDLVTRLVDATGAPITSSLLMRPGTEVDVARSNDLLYINDYYGDAVYNLSTGATVWSDPDSQYGQGGLGDSHLLYDWKAEVRIVALP